MILERAWQKLAFLFLVLIRKNLIDLRLTNLLPKADFVVMRNRNVAHHSVQFAKEACKATDTPFWISSNFGLETIIKQLSQTFPDESFESTDENKKSKRKIENRVIQKQNYLAESAQSKESQNYLKGKKKHLPLKSALKDFKITDDEPDFTKLFKK